VTSATPVREPEEAAPEAPRREDSAPPPASGPERAREREQPQRSWVGAARSARTRILAAYGVFLIVAAVLSIVALRQILLIRVEDQAGDALEQELRELDRLLVDGRDPATGAPFVSLGDLFDVYFARNVPSNDEALLAFVGGDLYLSSVARFPLDRLPAESLADWETLSAAFPGEGQSATGTFDSALGTGYFRASRIRFGDDSGAFVVTILPAEELDEIRELLSYGIAATVAILLLASAGAWFIAGRALAPVRQLTETARTISQSDLTKRVEVRGTGEAAEMARTFNAMLDRLETVFRSQREFVEDASHELRDPLTICRGHLELLGEDPDEQRQTVALVTDELDRMTRAVDDLALLADSEHPDFLRPEPIDLDLFAHELIAKASALATRDWQLDRATHGVVVADRHRLTEAVMNLAQNATKHTDESDTIAVGTGLRNGEVRIWVRDTGRGISPADQARIFDRFTRGTGAHRRYRGSGLGLAIVKAIAEAHGGRVELESAVAEGSTFTIIVPREPGEGGDVVTDPHS
jgi:two-component system, OmpR family, sensor kinase